MRLLAFIVVLICALSSASIGATSKVVDFIDDRDFGEIIDEVCDDEEGFGHQIGRISTIQGLANQLDTHQKLASCNPKFRESIAALNNVVSHEANLCSTKRIALLEQFHRDYVSTVSKFKEVRRETGKAAPHMLKVFFMHYASHVSTVCSELVSGMLKKCSSESTVKEVIKELLTNLSLDQDLNSVKGYNDIFLVWNLMASLSSSKLNKYLELDKEVKVTVEVSDASNTHKLQDVCRSMAKPYYSVAMLPVVRLIDLGYYPETESFLEQVQQDEFSRAIYSLTVLCENFLPVRFVNNKALPDGKMLMVETSRARSKYGLPSEEPTRTIHVTTLNNINISDKFISERLDDARALAKRIKSQVKARGKVMKQLIKLIINIIKKKPASTLNVLFMGEAEEPVSEYLSEVDEQEIPNISEDDTELEEVRHRRSLKNILKASLNAIQYVAVAILWFLIVWVPARIFLPVYYNVAFALHYFFVVRGPF